MPQVLTAKGKSTRARIVQAAAELVAEKGAAAMSLDDVCERAHASRSQLYHYFDDRDDLVRAVVNATTDSVLLAQDGLLEHLDTWTGIDRWFRALVALQEEREARGGCPIGSLVGQLAERDPGARENLADGFKRWEGHLREGLERMQDRGRLSVHADPASLATPHYGAPAGRAAAHPGPPRPRAAAHRPGGGPRPVAKRRGISNRTRMSP
jgi:TetR/AcrR family transcriptional regulator, transcriptional repressor for nem operon